MALRRALLIDPDRQFHDKLSRALAPFGMSVQAVTDGSDGLGQVAEIDPEIIFIAVELPDKLGYSICNKAKKTVARKIPVVLVTSSVPPAGLAEHRKLKTRADEYIDKRTASESELVQKVDGLVSLGPPVDREVSGMEELPVDAEDIHFDDEPMADGPGDQTTIVPASMVDPGIDAETDAVFAGLVETPLDGGVEETDIGAESAPMFDAQQTGVRASYPAGTTDPASHDNLDLGLDAVAEDASQEPEGEPSAGHLAAQHIANLEAEVDRLRGQLDEAKRTPAAPSQFSREREFLNLREVINRKEKEILDLREEVDAKDRVILGGKDKLRELDRKVRDAEEKLLTFEGNVVTANEQITSLREDKDKATEREKGLKARIDLAQAQLRKNDEEFENLKKRTTAEAAAAAAEIANRKKELEQTKRDSAERGARLEADKAAALQKAAEDHKAAVAAREKTLVDERDGQLAALRADFGDKLERARQEAAAALAAARAEAQKQAQQLTSEKDVAIAKAERERKEALQKAADEHAAAAAAAEQQRLRELQAAEEKRLSELRAAEDRRQNELRDQQEQHESTLDDHKTQHAAAFAGLEDKGRKDAGAAEQRRKDELAAAEQKRKEDLAAAEERRVKELFAADTKRREELGASEDQHTRELGALKRQHDEHVAAASSARQAAEEALRAEIEGHKDDLAGTRARLAGTETDLGQTKDTLAAREATLANTERELADRESRLATARAEIERLEGENTTFQEQLLKAYQKIKSDEAIANKAKKAMAIALTLLDGEPKPLTPSASSDA